MNGFALLAMLAGVGTVGSFLTGMRSMIYCGKSNSASSTVWMMRRVMFQGAAIVTVLAGVLSKMS